MFIEVLYTLSHAARLIKLHTPVPVKQEQNRRVLLQGKKLNRTPLLIMVRT